MGKHIFVWNLNIPPDSAVLPTLKGGVVVEDKKSRVERKMREKRMNGEKYKSKGVATFRFVADLGRVFNFLESLFNRLDL